MWWGCIQGERQREKKFSAAVKETTPINESRTNFPGKDEAQRKGHISCQGQEETETRYSAKVLAGLGWKVQSLKDGAHRRSR